VRDCREHRQAWRGRLRCTNSHTGWTDESDPVRFGRWSLLFHEVDSLELSFREPCVRCTCKRSGKHSSLSRARGGTLICSGICMPPARTRFMRSPARSGRRCLWRIG
jgi:hypothetical protein